ncbi:MAG: protein kinase [Xanthomonadales bacterium]|nr:protein kinase [Xanthomonadales bacterium]
MPRFAVNNVEIDTDAREVWSDGESQPLEPRAFDLLVFLIENQGRTVAKQELLDQVWQGRIVTDSVLTQAVAKCRRVLQDERAELIRTVHRVGYRFDGPVSRGAGGGSSDTVVVALSAQKLDLERLDIAADATLEGDYAAVQCESVGRGIETAIALQAQGATGGIGIHAGPPSDDEQDQPAPSRVARALASAGAGGQILLSATGFELGRNHPGLADVPGLAWLAHGTYRLAGLDAALSLFEVGVPGKAPMAAPADSDCVRRAGADDVIPGWRAAPGQVVPGRSNWVLEQNLGEGGFGEAWLAQHEKTREQRVFKFCYRADRLRSLQREVTLCRLLLEALGERPDIARILDWNFDQPPYFIESEYTPDGDLVKWLQRQGGAEAVSLSARLGLVAQTARALAAAHAVGVLHKDVKPSNILIRESESAIQASLCDFGIGLVTDRDALLKHDITQMGMTEVAGGNTTTARSGTRRYMAPELLEGGSPTIQADIYALGIVLYQMATGDLDRVLAPGWEREIDDPILKADISEMVDRDPARRPADASSIAARIETLDHRREQMMQRAAAQAKRERERRRRRILLPAGVVALVAAVVMGFLSWRVSQEAERANQQALVAMQQAERSRAVSGFLAGMFATDPMAPDGMGLSAVDILDIGRRSISRDFADDAQVRAELRTAIGAAYTGLSDLAQARGVLEDAAEDITQAAPDVRMEWSIAMAELERLSDNFDAAEQHLVDALSYVPSAEDSMRAAQSLHSSGQVDAAVKEYQLNSLLRARLLFELGQLYGASGDYDRSLEYFSQCLEIRQRWLPASHSLVMDAVQAIENAGAGNP